MAEIPAVVRRLAAILVADVAGYSRLIEADEEGTLGRLKALCAGVIDPKIARHHGRIVKTTGDGLLVEFASVVDALRCAADTSAPPNRKSAGRRCQAAVASSAMTSAIVRCVVKTFARGHVAGGSGLLDLLPRTMSGEADHSKDYETLWRTTLHHIGSHPDGKGLRRIRRQPSFDFRKTKFAVDSELEEDEIRTVSPPRNQMVC